MPRPRAGASNATGSAAQHGARRRRRGRAGRRSRPRRGDRATREPDAAGLPRRAAGRRVPGADVVTVGPTGPPRRATPRWRAAARPVLALVEDDVAVGAGLAARRGTAPGPTRAPPSRAARWTAPVLRVEGPSPTYPGGNVAFRAAALRGAGGFWPARGDPDQRDWFSEEHEAQRELARIGWASAWVPAWRRAAWDGRPPLRQRLRAGARRQAVGEPRPAPEAARALVTGLGGAVLGRRRERLGRAAENLGVLAGPRLVRAELEPVAAATPFRASVPRPRPAAAAAPAVAGRAARARLPPDRRPGRGPDGARRLPAPLGRAARRPALARGRGARRAGRRRRARPARWPSPSTTATPTPCCCATRASR